MTKNTNYGQRLGFGGVTISMCIGLAAQDTAENALAELGMDKIRLKGPLYHGDTLYCYTRGHGGARFRTARTPASCASSTTA